MVVRVCVCVCVVYRCAVMI